MKVKPCNGEPPLADPDTRREYDCGSGPNRQDCPSGSYCHQTPHFARCCKKGKGPQFKLKVLGAYSCSPLLYSINNFHSPKCGKITDRKSCLLPYIQGKFQ